VDAGMVADVAALVAASGSALGSVVGGAGALGSAVGGAGALGSLAAGVAAGLAVAVPLGPVGLLIIGQGLAHGRRSGLAAAAGVATVDATYCALAVAVGAVLAPLVATWAPWPGYVSGLVVVALGVQRLVVALRRGAEPVAADEPAPARRSHRSVYGTFVALTAVNPMTLLYFTALAGGLAAVAGSSAGAVLFVVGVGGASFGWATVLALTGSALGAWTSGSVTRVLELLAAGLVVVLGLGVLVATATA